MANSITMIEKDTVHLSITFLDKSMIKDAKKETCPLKSKTSDCDINVTLPNKLSVQSVFHYYVFTPNLVDKNIGAMVFYGRAFIIHLGDDYSAFYMVLT